MQISHQTQHRHRSSGHRKDISFILINQVTATVCVSLIRLCLSHVSTCLHQRQRSSFANSSIASSWYNLRAVKPKALSVGVKRIGAGGTPPSAISRHLPSRIAITAIVMGTLGSVGG
eukprot:TRINITY_DN3144_c0_g1_i1.p2 TRINITY_DN3144_c0_g1~~TRINITY_DN3144_c0_g1_i1.p2  ORF type:complete len:117 (-),score=4.08 TRINITY_DN3144_c0_g1_i1:110-460(-)